MTCRHGREKAEECLRCERDFVEVQIRTLQTSAHRVRAMAQKYAALQRRLDELDKRLEKVR